MLFDMRKVWSEILLIYEKQDVKHFEKIFNLLIQILILKL